MRGGEKIISDRIPKDEFKDHCAKYMRFSEEIELIEFRIPKTGYGFMRFVRCGSVISFSGDFGASVFIWNQSFTFIQVLSFSFEYFLRKCDASEVGRDFCQWDSEALRKEVKEYLGEERLAVYEAKGAFQCQSYSEFLSWFQQNSDPGEDIILESGNIPHIRALYQYYGLIAAITQLIQKKILKR